MDNQKTHIGNVNILDLRNASEESIARIESVGNVNVAIVTRQTAALVSRMHIGNLNSTIEVPEGANVRQLIGQTHITGDFFKDVQEPLCLICIGQIIIEPDVPADAFSKSIHQLAIIGQVLCPEGLAGLLHSKAISMVGETKTYPVLAQFRSDSLILDEDVLNGMADLLALQVLPNDLLEHKLSKLFVLEEITCHAENAAVLKSRLVGFHGGMTVIPEGFTLVEKPFTLDETVLEYLPGRKLYCTDRVVVTAGVTPALLEKKLEQLTCKEIVLCPATLKTAFAARCNPFENKVIFYEGELWLVDNSETFSAARFEYLTGKTSLIVFGEVRLDPEVAPAMLAEKLAQVHLFGVIWCTPAQMAVLQTRPGAKEGELLDSTRVEPKEEEDSGGIGNVNLLTL
jgi:hypothetical protein